MIKKIFLFFLLSLSPKINAENAFLTKIKNIECNDANIDLSLALSSFATGIFAGYNTNKLLSSKLSLMNRIIICATVFCSGCYFIESFSKEVNAVKLFTYLTHLKNDIKLKNMFIALLLLGSGIGLFPLTID